MVMLQGAVLGLLMTRARVLCFHSFYVLGCPSIAPIPWKNDEAGREPVDSGREKKRVMHGKHGGEKKRNGGAQKKKTQHAPKDRQSVRIPSLFLCR